VKLTDQTLEEFLAELGADSPAPGGGSAAALAGAAAAALCAMVCRLTLAREASEDSLPSVKEALRNAESLGGRLRELIDQDAEAYLAVVSARALPRATHEEKAARRTALQAATVRAAATPMETLDNLHACVKLVELLVTTGIQSCVTDAGSAGAIVRAGAIAAEYNVRVNLPSITDESVRNSYAVRARTDLADIEAAADRIAQELENRLNQRSTQ
jgi:formiminotetrahydrofolate cyclodeaminase